MDNQELKNIKLYISGIYEQEKLLKVYGKFKETPESVDYTMGIFNIWKTKQDGDLTKSYQDITSVNESDWKNIKLLECAVKPLKDYNDKKQFNIMYISEVVDMTEEDQAKKAEYLKTKTVIQEQATAHTKPLEVSKPVEASFANNEAKVNEVDIPWALDL